MNNTQKRLDVLEQLFAQQLETRVAELRGLAVARFGGDDLRAVAQLLRFVATGACNPVLARYGATLLETWRAEVGADLWRDMWSAAADDVGEACAVLLSDDARLD